MKAKTNVTVQDENGNSSKPLLCEVFINELPNTDEKIIDKYTKQISKEFLSTIYGGCH